VLILPSDTREFYQTSSQSTVLTKMEDKPPAYSERLFSPTTLSQSLSTARTTRIVDTIEASIEPHWQYAASRGLGHITLVLMPSDLTYQLAIDSKGPKPEVIGFPSENYVQVIPLSGDENNLDFWRQPSVIKDLESHLKSILAASGHRIREEKIEIVDDSRAVSVLSPSESSRGGFFRRKQSSSSSTMPALPSTSARSLGAGEVTLVANVQDISFRLLTDMGLYETKTGKGVAIQIEIGS
jgi:hypothetical protein